jgi:steroid delta-isomerase-like uncharacterized protein
MDNIELVKKHLDAFCAGRWDAYKSDLAKNAVYEEISTRAIVKGADEYVAFVQRWMKAFPDLKANVLGAYASGDRVFVEVEWSGTHTGPFEGPFGAIAPTNKRGSLRAAMAFRVENGKIVENHHYFDVLSVLTQLGVIPGLGAPMPAAKPAASPPPRHT